MFFSQLLWIERSIEKSRITYNFRRRSGDMSRNCGIMLVLLEVEHWTTTLQSLYQYDNMNKDEGFHLTSNWSFVLTGSFFCVNVYVLCKMYVKHRYSLEPTHIFEMSTVFDIVLWSATFILTNFEKYFENLAPFCIILNFVDSNTRKVLKWQISLKS